LHVTSVAALTHLSTYQNHFYHKHFAYRQTFNYVSTNPKAYMRSRSIFCIPMPISM